MTNAAAERDLQTELVGDDIDLLLEAIHGALVNVHTNVVGAIKSYDSSKQTCTVQPSIKRVYTQAGAKALPVLQDVPVIFTGGALTFEISEGDECIVLIAERCIDSWFANGGVQEPSELRMHDLSDGFALVGPNSLKHLITAIGSGTELRLRDGSSRIAVRADGRILLGVSQGGPAGDVELLPPINGVVLAKGIDPFTKMPYYALGSSSQNVLAKP